MPTIATVLDKHLTTVLNCLQNVVYVLLLASFVDNGMFLACFAATRVSPVDSWRGLLFNMWFGALVLVMMVTFKNTLEFLFLFENAKRLRDSKIEDDSRAGSTTVCMVDKESVSFKHVDHRSAEPNPSWSAIASFMIATWIADSKMASTPSPAEPATEEEPATEAATEAANEDPATEAATEDDIKQDAISASSSARSSADTDALN